MFFHCSQYLKNTHKYTFQQTNKNNDNKMQTIFISIFFCIINSFKNLNIKIILFYQFKKNQKNIIKITNYKIVYIIQSIIDNIGYLKKQINMLQRLYRQIIPTTLKTILINNYTKYTFSTTNNNNNNNTSNPLSISRRSQQQQTYYDSRLTMYNKHGYPHYKPTITLLNFVNKYKGIKQLHDVQTNQSKNQNINKNASTTNPTTTSNNNQYQQLKPQKVVGRISAIRRHGKTTFIDIRQQHIRLQITIKTDKELSINRGDIIGVQGIPFITKKGQLSLNCTNINQLILLAPCMWMLPEYQGLKDTQVRYRNKPLDLLTNKNSVQIIKKRAKVISTLRSQLLKQQYIEVQTPILSPSCGGAIAKPFITYHNDHKSDLFLRIAPELYLKKLLVGGLSRVFEIGKNFRNQSIDQTHNPQFTSCQLYCAYEDYRGMIQFTYKLLNKIAVQVNGSSIIKGKNRNGEEVLIDLSQKWKQVDFMSGLQQALKMKLPINFEDPQTIKFYDNLCVKNNIPCQQPRSIQRLLDKLAGHYLQTTHQPFLIMNHPKIMSPLAKPIPTAPHLTQRFQLFINGWQIVNSYTQLNDPRIQKQNTPTDIDFVQALQYGLVPCAGWGIGLDRFVMLLTGSQRIQQVIVFPLLREMLPGNKDKDKEKDKDN